MSGGQLAGWAIFFSASSWSNGLPWAFSWQAAQVSRGDSAKPGGDRRRLVAHRGVLRRSRCRRRDRPRSRRLRRSNTIPARRLPAGQTPWHGTSGRPDRSAGLPERLHLPRDRVGLGGAEDRIGPGVRAACHLLNWIAAFAGRRGTRHRRPSRRTCSRAAGWPRRPAAGADR